jgi:hypothetical protein
MQCDQHARRDDHRGDNEREEWESTSAVVCHGNLGSHSFDRSPGIPNSDSAGCEDVSGDQVSATAAVAALTSATTSSTTAGPA